MLVIEGESEGQIWRAGGEQAAAAWQGVEMCCSSRRNSCGGPL